MATKDSNAELQEAILVLESKQKEELKRLKKEFTDVKERLKPKNLMLAGLNKIKHSSAIRTVLIVAGVGLASGLIYKKVSSRRRKHHEKKMQYVQQNQASSQVKNISGSLIKYIITAIISQNSARIKEMVMGLLNKLKSTPKPQNTSNDSGIPSEKESVLR
jgi:predicted small secreted protein